MTTPTYEPVGTWITDPGDPRLVVLWPAAEDYEPDDLGFPLNVARIQCERFAPALAVDAPIPDNYVAAQVMQARALVRAGMVGSGDQAGGYGDTVTVFPMDWNVKNLLRPRKGRPYFGGKR
ncbi:MAG: hypothetical protein CVT65_14520 [Actinobacteria bacterium HGW-Actinobacteria-5]|jgi:hypothetical protein|nr:MAG: hypothetical protein CVT65_14520 [Actinobacteria bacterium HGW-Actinobacteria-5]